MTEIVSWEKIVALLGGLVCREDLPALQAIVGLLGTWFLAFGLARFVRMSEWSFVNSVLSIFVNWKFWFGLVLITCALSPPIIEYFLIKCPQ